MNEIGLFGFLSPLLLLYAETHYAFKGIYSRLKKDEPEIIADVPRRIEPGRTIPVLILIKDANLYPLKLLSIEIELRGQNLAETRLFDLESAVVQQCLWHRILEVQLPQEFQGHCTLDVRISVRRNGKTHEVRNDNYVSTSHAPFDVTISEHELPKSARWYFGEFHCHTNYTCDQVEFGAPLQAAVTLAQAMGLSYYCATDHSYDLDDDEHDYLKKDPHLSKWKSLLGEIKNLNEANSGFVIVPGEEVSAGNAKNRNVHFLVLNNPEFLPGDGDSAERWFRTKPNLSIEEVLARIGSEALAFAAHPAMRPPFLQWLLVRRGRWGVQDCNHSELHGLQIWNGTDVDFDAGRKIWVQLLLQGQRKFISGGNDAHGNFNRFRQIGLPFFTMREHDKHLFGKVRTGVLSHNGLSLESLLQAFKKGRMVVTNGPFVDLRMTNGNGRVARLGDTISGGSFKIVCECLSTPEFGPLKELKIYQGILGRKEESLVAKIEQFGDNYDHSTTHDFGDVRLPRYLRAELLSQVSGMEFRCLTNPIWVHGAALE